MRDSEKSRSQLIEELDAARQELARCKEVEKDVELLLAVGSDSQRDLRRYLNQARAVRHSLAAASANAGFLQCAERILEMAKSLTGAIAGYVALLDPTESTNELLYLDSGGMPCTVDPSLPMPVRGLRAEAYRLNRAVYENDFWNSPWMEFMPYGHARLDNVMFAPLSIDGKAIGLIGIGNKPGGFNEEDVRATSKLAEVAALALTNVLASDVLQESEARYQCIIENAQDPIISVDGADRIILWNRAAEAAFGYGAAEALGQPALMLIPERLRDSHAGTIRRWVLSEGEGRQGRTIELLCRRKDGSEFQAEVSVAAWKSGEGHNLTGIVRDVTLKRRAEEQLEITRAGFISIVENSPDCTLVLDSQGRIIYANPAAEVLFGKSPEALVGTDFGLPVVPGSAAEVDIVLAGGKTGVAEMRMDRADWKGQSAFLAIFRDFTERKRIEENLYRQSALLEAINKVLMETLACGTDTEVAGTCLQVAEELTGSEYGWIGEINSQGRLDTIALSDKARDVCTISGEICPALLSDMDVRGLWGTVIRTGQSIIMNDMEPHMDKLALPAGHPRIGCFMGVPLKRAGRPIGMIALANRTGGYGRAELDQVEALSPAFVEALDKQRSQTALRESEERFRQLAENIDEVFVLIKPGRSGQLGELLYLSPAFEVIWGRPRDQVLGGQSALKDYVHPDDKEQFISCYANLDVGGSNSELEYRIIRPDGSVRWIWERGFAISDDNGTIHRLARVAQDATGRKLAQQRQAELVEEVKQFAYIISHDLRSPIINLTGFSGELRSAMAAISPLVSKALAEGPADRRSALEAVVNRDLPECVDFIESSVRRMDRLIEAILKLSRMERSDLDFELLDLNSIVQGALKALAYQIQERGIKVHVSPLLNVIADRTAMEQIVSNLLDNAIKFLDPSRPGLVEICSRINDEGVIVEVSDNGRGIPPADQKRVFDIFRRAGTQDVPGEGLGLTYARALVRRHGGRLWCRSEPDIGSTFLFMIPSRKLG